MVVPKVNGLKFRAKKLEKACHFNLFVMRKLNTLNIVKRLYGNVSKYIVVYPGNYVPSALCLRLLLQAYKLAILRIFHAHRGHLSLRFYDNSGVNFQAMFWVNGRTNFCRKFKSKISRYSFHVC